jgi:hypothetical protein
MMTDRELDEIEARMKGTPHLFYTPDTPRLIAEIRRLKAHPSESPVSNPETLFEEREP